MYRYASVLTGPGTGTGTGTGTGPGTGAGRYELATHIVYSAYRSNQLWVQCVGCPQPARAPNLAAHQRWKCRSTAPRTGSTARQCA